MKRRCELYSADLDFVMEAVEHYLKHIEAGSGGKLPPPPCVVPGLLRARKAIDMLINVPDWRTRFAKFLEVVRAPVEVAEEVTDA